MPSTSITAQVGRSWSDCPHCTLSSRFSGVSPSLNSGPGRSRFRGGDPVCAQTWFLQLQAQRLKPHTLLLTGSLDLASQGVTQQEPPISYQDNLPAPCWLERMASWETPAPPAQPSYSLTLTLGQAGVPTSGLCLARGLCFAPCLVLLSATLSSIFWEGAGESHPPAPDLSCPAWSLAGAFICQSLRTGSHAAYCLHSLVRCSKKCMDGHFWEVNKAQYTVHGSATVITGTTLPQLQHPRAEYRGNGMNLPV